MKAGKALTCHQPYASLLVAVPRPPKRWETRSWRTSYCGPLWIHAAAKEPQAVRRRFLDDPRRRELLIRTFAHDGIRDPEALLEDLPRGAVVGEVYLQECRLVEELDHLTPQEALLGVYQPGRYVWITCGSGRLLEPVPAKGAQGLWDYVPPQERVTQ